MLRSGSTAKPLRSFFTRRALGQGMSAAKHPYNIRNERGEFARVAPEVRAALEQMQYGVLEPMTDEARDELINALRDEKPRPIYVESIYRPARRPLWQRIKEYFMWHPR